MKVVIIGSGNVASALGDKILAAGYRIVQVAGRNPRTVMVLAENWQCQGVTDWKAVHNDADIYVVALADSALPGLGKLISLPGKPVVHTAGALPANTLVEVSARTGVLYPLQSFRSGVPAPTEFPLLIDTVQPGDLPLIRDFASPLVRQVVQADDEYRLKLHVAAVLVNNFTTHLYTLAGDYCHQEQLDFSLLLPLIRETALRIDAFPPQELQTGPAFRGDQNTLEMHGRALSKYQDIKNLYSLFSNLIEAYYRRDQNP